MDPASISISVLSSVRSIHPMVHHITNSVVMNLTANITLCLGAAPVMAQCIDESAEMVRFAGALLLNIGTLDPPLVKSMIRAGRAANELGIPVILDPVGAGATGLRTESAATILKELKLSVIRGNAGEILALAGEQGRVRGVDSTDTVDGRLEIVSALSKRTGSVVAVTGVTDIVTDGERAIRIENGHPLMGRITGTGCGATTAVACFTAVEKDPFKAAAGALISFGIAGEIAAGKSEGPGTFVPHFLDALYSLDERVIVAGTKAEVLS